MISNLISNSHDHSDALMHVSRLLNSTLDLDQLLELVMDIAIEVLAAERGFLMLMNPDAADLNFTVARNFDRKTLSESEFEISRSVVMHVSKGGEPLLTDNASLDPRFQAHQSIVAYRLRSILCVPLTVKEEVTGVIYVDNRMRAGAFEEHDRNFLVSFGHMAAVAIENARLFQRVQSNLAETRRLKVLMDNVFASVASGVITVGADGRITLMNRAALQMLRRDAGDMIGRRLEEVLPWLVARPMPDMLAQVISGQEEVATLALSTTIRERGETSFRITVSRLTGEAAGSVVIVLEDRTQESILQQAREREELAKNRLQSMLQRYLSPTIAGRLASSPDDLTLGGERQEITALFADLRGFTTLAEHMPPEDLVKVLNRYLGLAVHEIFEQEGTLDKFLGDAIMAIFNAPVRQPDHVTRALRAAIAIRERVHELWSDLPQEFRLSFGIGVNVGEAIVGNIGSDKRMDYTAIGDSVNVAERLEELARPGQILISQEILTRVNDLIDVQSLQSMPMRGRQTHMLVYELIDIRPDD
jgi:adenylate cyclase